MIFIPVDTHLKIELSGFTAAKILQQIVIKSFKNVITDLRLLTKDRNKKILSIGPSIWNEC